MPGRFSEGLAKVLFGHDQLACEDAAMDHAGDAEPQGLVTRAGDAQDSAEAALKNPLDAVGIAEDWNGSVGIVFEKGCPGIRIVGI